MNVGALAGGHAEAMASQYHNLDSLRDLKTQAKTARMKRLKRLRNSLSLFLFK